ncbi:MAG: hypothetical protein COA32_14805 [Fluviicola sp.]|nr:MAG: hypothetical protein COA32_14805 [Fluviicola sp.]
MLLWISLMIIFFINLSKRVQIHKIIKSNHPEIKSIISYHKVKHPLSLIKKASMDFVRMHINFGGIKHTKEFISNFLDLESITKTNNYTLINLTNQFIFITRSFSIILNLLFITVIVGLIMFL